MCGNCDTAIMATNYDSDSSEEFNHESLLEPQVILNDDEYQQDGSDDDDNMSSSSLLEVQIDDRWGLKYEVNA